MKTIAIAQHPEELNQLTTTISLAGALAAEGFSVLIVEANPDSAISSYFINKTQPAHMLADIFKTPENLQNISANSLVCESGIENISLILAGDDLASSVTTHPGMGLVIHQLLTLLGAAYEYILIVCPMALNALMVNTLAAAHMFFIPIISNAENLDTVTKLLSIAEMIETSKKSSLEKIIIPIEHDNQDEDAVRSISALKEAFDEHLWNGFIPLDPNFNEAEKQNIPISELNPKTPGAVAYRRFLSELQ